MSGYGHAMTRSALTAAVAVLVLLAVVAGTLAVAVKALKWLLIVAALLLLLGLVSGVVGRRSRR
jgi:hypothetical protein